MARNFSAMFLRLMDGDNSNAVDMHFHPGTHHPIGTIGLSPKLLSLLIEIRRRTLTAYFRPI